MKERRNEHPAVKGLRVTMIGVVVNLFLATIKGFAGIYGNSYALIADSIESASDILNSLIVWAGLRIAMKAPDKDHPYGHGKAEPIATVLVSVFLMTGSVIVALQSIKAMFVHHEAPHIFTLPVLLVVIIVKEVLFRYILKTGKEIESTVVKADALHHRTDAISSAAAFIGILIAIVGGKGFENADKWAALFTAGIIAFNAVVIFIPAIAEVMDTALSTDIEEQVRKVAIQVEGVKALDKCHVRKMGFEYFVDLHIVVDGNLTVREGHTIAHKVKEALKKSNERIYDALIHVEPL